MYQKFETKVKYEKIDVNGRERTVSENYLIEAVNFSDAEERIHEQLQPFINGQFSVEAIRKSNYAELFVGDGDLFFKVKVAFISIDEERGIEKKASSNFLVQANTSREAIDKIDIAFKSTVSDYEVNQVVETSILYVFFINNQNNEED